MVYCPSLNSEDLVISRFVAMRLESPKFCFGQLAIAVCAVLTKRVAGMRLPANGAAPCGSRRVSPATPEKSPFLHVSTGTERKVSTPRRAILAAEVKKK